MTTRNDDLVDRAKQAKLESNDIIISYNVETLVEYMLATGDFVEPTTRLPFSDEQLEEIDTLFQKVSAAKVNKAAAIYSRERPRTSTSASVSDFDINTEEECRCNHDFESELSPVFTYQSVLEAKRSVEKQAEWAAKRERRDMLEGLERCLAEVVVAMIDGIDKSGCIQFSSNSVELSSCIPSSTSVSPSSPPPPQQTATAVSSLSIENGTMALVSKFHEFDYYLSALKKEDPELALASVSQYIELVKGPKNKRRIDMPIRQASNTRWGSLVGTPAYRSDGLLSILLKFLERHVKSLKNMISKSKSEDS